MGLMLLTHLMVLLPALMLVRPVTSRGHGGRTCWKTNVNNANVTCLDGHGGESCGEIVCLADEDVECVGDKKTKCQCKGDYDKGNGIIVCAQPHEHVCYMISDPRLKTYSGASAVVPVSCMFLMSAFETYNPLSIGRVECYVEAFTWGVKGRGTGRKGKHFTGGMEISITVAHANTIYYHSTRIHGEARNGAYRFLEQVSKVEGGPYGYATTTVIPGVGVIYTEYDSENNIAEVRADFCGVRMGFRPAEFVVDKTDDQLDPGVYIKVNGAYSPVFTGGLCLIPSVTIDDYRLKLEKEIGKKVDAETAMMFLAIENPVSQNFPDAPPILEALAKTARDCEHKSLVCAIQNCMFITKLPKFMKCCGKRCKEERPGGNSDNDVVSRRRRHVQEGEEEENEDNDSAEENKIKEIRRMNKILQLMHRCFQAFCSQSSMICDVVQGRINATQCHTLIPEKQQNIMDVNCAELEPAPPNINP